MGGLRLTYYYCRLYSTTRKLRIDAVTLSVSSLPTGSVVVATVVARIANDDEHSASPKAHNIKTQPFTPTAKLSVGLQNINNKHSKVMSCHILYLTRVPLPAFSFHG